MRKLSLAFLLAFPLFASAETWPAMPAAVSSLGAIEADGYLYIYGGHAGKTHSYDTKTALGSFHRLKLDGGTKWEELAGGPQCQGMNLAVHNGRIIRVGGMQPRNEPGTKSDNHSLADAAIYDPKTKKWEALPELPAGRSSHDLAVVGDTLVVVGGWNQGGKDGKTTWHDTTLTLDLAKAGAKWTSVKQPFQRRALTSAVLGTKVYVLCGLDEKGATHKTTDIFDVATGKWSSGPELPGEGKMGFSPAATILDKSLVVSTSDGNLHKLNGDKWEKVGASEAKRMVHRLVPYKKGVVLVGGATGGGNAAELEFVELGK